jgi:hypothetical protein
LSRKRLQANSNSTMEDLHSNRLPKCSSKDWSSPKPALTPVVRPFPTRARLSRVAVCFAEYPLLQLLRQRGRAQSPGCRKPQTRTRPTHLQRSPLPVHVCSRHD